jgi:hypothetical protein
MMSDPNHEILVDAHWLEPPETMEKVMHTLDLPHPGLSIRLLLLREPFPPYPLPSTQGYQHDTRMQADDSHVIPIRQWVQGE